MQYICREPYEYQSESGERKEIKKGVITDIRLAPGIGTVEVCLDNEKHYITDDKLEEHYISY